MGFTPGVPGSCAPFLNPKAGKLFKMAFAPQVSDGQQGFHLHGRNIVDGFRNLGYCTIGSGAVDWFNTATPTGSVLPEPFQHFYFAGSTWNLPGQLAWIEQRLSCVPHDQPVFLFLNVGETHVPYWHEGASWERFPSPCAPFGGADCSAMQSRLRQRACLEWVDSQLSKLIGFFLGSTILACADHGDCWGEDGLWEHGISHPCTLTVPLLMRVRGEPVHADPVSPLARAVSTAVDNLVSPARKSFKSIMTRF